MSNEPQFLSDLKLRNVRCRKHQKQGGRSIRTSLEHWRRRGSGGQATVTGLPAHVPCWQPHSEGRGMDVRREPVDLFASRYLRPGDEKTRSETQRVISIMMALKLAYAVRSKPSSTWPLGSTCTIGLKRGSRGFRRDEMPVSKSILRENWRVISPALPVMCTPIGPLKSENSIRNALRYTCYDIGYLPVLGRRTGQMRSKPSGPAASAPSRFRRFQSGMSVPLPMPVIIPAMPRQARPCPDLNPFPALKPPGPTLRYNPQRASSSFVIVP
ncbi:uncharacterized protein F5Z01DRAFT_634799 [Emericellopsis atlantica]|uniref:Uncharacterized protein n=1 Tax=Emericellopsis atlantica TaxID=2614577 RepID=A0A9P8CQZ8_9HYPO|nr:uncharacterized protein F5Z01DRAFT_634799 [Emericellopsis atlantica]KAG9256484.1 hypothetical protein F5Z01DRAFT_634799 [Emericellopsis atlantica]